MPQVLFAAVNPYADINNGVMQIKLPTEVSFENQINSRIQINAKKFDTQNIRIVKYISSLKN